MAKSNIKIFVLDTNVLLHDYKCIYNFQDNDIVIPIVALEELDIDCYGDQAKVSEISSTMFADTPTMVELPDYDGPMTLKKKLKRP